MQRNHTERGPKKTFNGSRQALNGPRQALNGPRQALKDLFDVARVLHEFPKIELSYETVVHKNVQSNCVALIPMGQPCFAWFTTYDEHNACFIVDTRRKTVERVLTGFDSSLCMGLGTILYGTFFYTYLDSGLKARMFAANDIFYYKGECMETTAKYSTRKFNAFKQLFSSGEIEQSALTSKCVVFGLTCISTSLNDLLEIASHVPYKIKYVQFGNIDSDRAGVCNTSYEECLQQGMPFALTPIAPTLTPVSLKPTAPPITITAITHVSQTPFTHTRSLNKLFTVKPDVRPDTYHLSQSGVEIGLACIPNFKCSVMMNRLFRIIKENDRLDALEESDEEEEFENPDPYKFVHLSKSFNMMCEYNRKFKKWVPIKVV